MSGFEAAFKAHNAGRLAEAEQGYRAFLQDNPRHTDAWHLLGVVAQQQGRPAEAVEYVGRALDITGPHAGYLASLGNAFRALGQFERAIVPYQQALSLQPSNASTYNNLGSVYQMLGRLNEAAASYRQAVTHQPDYARAHYNLGVVLKDAYPQEAAAAFHKALDIMRRNPADADHAAAALSELGLLNKRAGRALAAVENLQEALKLRPDDFAMIANLGAVLLEAARPAEAEAQFRAALRFKPDSAEVQSNLGNALKAQDKLVEAAAAYESAAASDPAFALPRISLGFVLEKLGRPGDALRAYDDAARIAPLPAEAENGKGAAFAALGRAVEAVACFRRAAEKDPNFASAHLNAALTLLAEGDFAAGWAEHAWRWRVDPSGLRSFNFPEWQGQPDGTVLVWGEQGVGDRILYAGMISDILACGHDVVLESDVRLALLFQRSFPGITIVPKTDPPHAGTRRADIRWQSPIASLGRWLRPDRASFPARQSYLIPDAARRDRYRALLKDKYPGPVIGISWISRNPKIGQHKTMRLKDWASVLTSPGARIVDLQYGDTAAERAAVESELGVNITHVPDLDLREDLDGVAALAAACDLVLSVSNTTVHLAAAVGTPTWVLVPAASGNLWYWMREGEGTPWYANVTTFRQKARGDWDQVMADVAARLRMFSAG